MFFRVFGQRTSALFCSITLFVCVPLGAPLSAQTAPAASNTVRATGSVTGVINDAQQRPAAGVQIELSGAVTRRTQTDAAGSFALDDVPAGVYRINVTKGGFTPVQDVVTVTAGAITTSKLSLAQASFSSIKQIGRVAVSTNAANALNTSTASVATISGSTFIDQGQLNVNRTLNELPGVVIGVGSGFSGGSAGDGIANGASPLVTGIPQLRGSLPYETASLIDGHPISIGVYGTFNPAFINPYILQDTEIVKGPGASPTNIKYAIGGTVNFITLEPTRTAKQSFDVGVDQFGGQNANLRATGTLGRKLGYAFDDATTGTQGYDRGWDPLDPLNLSNGALVNGVPTCAGTVNAYSCFPQVIPTNTNFAAASNLTAPLVVCCPQTPMESSTRNELGKLRYSFTPSTSLTLTYLGGQIRGSSLAANLFTFPSYFFGPPAGYTGALTPGAATFENLQGDSALATNANLYAADFHTAAGPLTFNARYYAASVNTANLQYGDGPTPGSGSVYGDIYGGVPLGTTNVNPTIFNGTPGTVTLLNSYLGVRTKDKLDGFTFETDLPVGNNVYSFSYDTVHTKSSAATIQSNAAGDVITVPAGSGQGYQTFLLRGQFELRPGLQATLSNYATSYTDHYTQNFGKSFLDSSHAYDAPRLAFAWRPSTDLAVRASTGFSVAPPYINLLTNSVATPDRTPPTYFTVTANAGDVKPETSFGYDFGADRRLAGDTTISADVYETSLRDQFLATTSLSTMQYLLAPSNPYGGKPGLYPLYVTKTQNLGHSRYEGVELSLHRSPTVGLGFKLQGSLQRAYAYDLPAGFYATAAGPLTANLGILPNENFQSSGQGYNSLSPSRVPYSQGYAEINARARNGAYLLAGVTYFGPNNAYNEPPFGVVNASFRQPLSKRSSLLFAVTNVTGAYSAFRYNIYGGIPTPLVDGQLGYTAGNVVGPSTASLTLHVDL